jgi:hypothetical protein
VAGKVVLLDRGQCTFYAKYLNAARAGVAAILLADNIRGGDPMLLVRGQPDIDPIEAANPTPIVSILKAFRDELLVLVQRGEKPQVRVAFGGSVQDKRAQAGVRSVTWYEGAPVARICPTEDWVSAKALPEASAPRPFDYFYVPNNDENREAVHELTSRYVSPLMAAKNEPYEMEQVKWDMTEMPYEASCVLSYKDACIDPLGAIYDDLAIYEFPFNNREVSWKVYRNKDAKKFVQCRTVRTGVGKKHFKRLFHFAEVWSDAFSHSVFQTLPQIRIAFDKLAQYPESKILIKETGPLKSFLVALGIAEDRIVFHGELYSADWVHTVAYKQPPERQPYQPQLGLQPRGILNKFATALKSVTRQEETFVKQSLILYLKRSSEEVGRRRAVTNEDELLNEITLRLRPEFELKVFETVGYADQASKDQWMEDRELFQRAKVVFGPHGGAFGNIVFCQEKTSVIEFNTLTQQVWRPQYYGLSQMIGVDYSLVEPFWLQPDTGDEAQAVNPIFYRSPMRVPISATLKAFEHAGVLKERAKAEL